MVVAQIYKASLLAFSDIDRNQTRVKLQEPVCRSRYWSVEYTENIAETTGKNDTALIPVLNTFKITTYPHLGHRSNMAEYSFYNCIRYQNAKTRQSICSN